MLEETVSLQTLKTFIEKKTKRKTIVKVIWAEDEKITLLIPPNMKINSFIHDAKEGYLFFDQEGKMIKEMIPMILPEAYFHEGKINLHELRLSNQLTKEEILALKIKDSP